jgi:hypothetical protein
MALGGVGLCVCVRPDAEPGADGGEVYGLVLDELGGIRRRFPFPLGSLTPHTLALVLHEWARHRWGGADDDG